jgi:hypothetical protein
VLHVSGLALAARTVDGEAVVELSAPSTPDGAFRLGAAPITGPIQLAVGDVVAGPVELRIVG